MSRVIIGNHVYRRVEALQNLKPNQEAMRELAALLGFKSDRISLPAIMEKLNGRVSEILSEFKGNLVDIAKSIVEESMCIQPIPVIKKAIRKIRKIDAIESRYYIRIMAKDSPGVLSKTSGILAKEKISIADVSQKGRSQAKVVPLIMLTHEAKESSIKRALKKIDNMKDIEGRSVAIRLER